MLAIDTLKEMVSKTDTVTNISKVEAIELYKTLLEQENYNHNTFLVILLTVITIAFTLTWWWNKSESQKYITRKVQAGINEAMTNKMIELNRLIEERIVSLSSEQEKKFERQFLELEIEAYRATSIAITPEKEYAIYYTSKILESCIKLNSLDEIRQFSDVLLSFVESNESKAVFNLGEVKEIVGGIPDVYSKERKRILKLLEKFSEHNDGE